MTESDCQHLYDEAWWMQALEGELTEGEARQWEGHLAQCAACREEWAVLQQVEQWLAVAPKVPALSETFTTQTLARVAWALRFRRLWAMIAPTLIVGLVTWFVVSYLGLALTSLERWFNALVVLWQPLLGTFFRVLFGLLWLWQAYLPFIVAGVVGGVLFLMPNSVLATALMIWLARRRPTTLAT